LSAARKHCSKADDPVGAERAVVRWPRAEQDVADLAQRFGIGPAALPRIVSEAAAGEP
jgi:hypothetical protein